MQVTCVVQDERVGIGPHVPQNDVCAARNERTGAVEVERVAVNVELECSGWLFWKLAEQITTNLDGPFVDADKYKDGKLAI